MKIFLMIVSAFFVVVFTIVSLTHIYQFQICEYLFYRVKGMVSDSNLVKILFPFKLVFPARSVRNVIIFIVTFLVLVTYYFIIYTYLPENIIYQIVLLLFGYIIAKLGVVLGVIVTSPLAFLVRYRYIFLAKKRIQKYKPVIIGITGSYGKSSVKEYIHRILSTKYLVGKTRGNRNTSVGIGMELALQVRSRMKYFVAEMGAYRKGDIKRLCKLYPPKYGVVTGIGNQHLDLFGSRENIRKTKFEIMNDVKIGLYSRESGEGTGLSYGFDDSSDIQVKIIEFRNGITSFSVKANEKSEVYKTKLLGEHSILNLTPAIKIARVLGMKYEEVFNAVTDIDQVLGKLSVHEGSKGSSILNDSYNSNFNGFLSAVRVLSGLGSRKKYISSLGVFELGREKESSYKNIVNSVIDNNQILLTTDPTFSKFGNKESVLLFSNTDEILSYLFNKVKSGDILLIEGRHPVSFTKALGILKAY